MACRSATLESKVLEQFCCLGVSSGDSMTGNELPDPDIKPGLLYLSDEVLIMILKRLDPVSLLRLGGACCRLFQVGSCDSLWTRHFRVCKSTFFCI